MDWNLQLANRSKSLLLGVLIVGSTACDIRAQDAGAPAATSPDAPVASADETAIRAAGQAYAAAMNQGDAKALAEAWTADGDYIDASGQRHKARDLIAEDFGASPTSDRPHRLAVKESTIRMITPDVAVEDGLTETTAESTGAIAVGRFTAIWVKQEKWLLDCVRENGTLPLTDGEQLAPLTWMIGDWIGESGGLTYTLSVRWTDGNHFLVRHFAVREKEQVLVDGTQYVGWDPDRKAIRSWTFDSHGTRSEGDWSFVEGAWVVQNVSTLPDGRTTSTTSNYKQEPGSLTWTSPETTVEGEVVPARSVRFLHREPTAR
jgi:uncharacterized protein (TIGR02246 family)